MKPHWRIIGTSVQGTAHQQKDQPCQDAHSYRVLSNGIALFAVADGASSAARSAEGAYCVVERVIGAVENTLAKWQPHTKAGWQALLIEAFGQAREALVQLAQVEASPLKAFATTLTCAIATPTWLAVGQVGDGAVVAKGQDEQLFTTTQLQRGEYANETFFLTMDEALQRVEIQAYPQVVQALALTTDGLIRLALDLTQNEPHAPFFEPLLAFTAQVESEAEAQAQLTAFLVSERVCARTDDDKTLVLAVRTEL